MPTCAGIRVAALPSSARGRVLVTGLAGFTGAYLRRALEAAGFEVCGTSEPPEFDLREPESVNTAVRDACPDYVIHLAGISFIPHGNATDIYATNVVGVTHLLEAVRRNAPDVRKVVLASSANVYGVSDRDPIDESTPTVPVNHYACSKLSMEFMARTWFGQMPIVLTRPFNYTGPGQSEQFIIPKIVGHFARRAPTIDLGNLDVVRDFSDVRMVCDAYTRLLAAPIHSTQVNICSGTGRSLRWVLAQMELISGYRPEVRMDPALVRSVEVNRLVGSNDRLRAAIGELQYQDFGTTLQWMWSTAESSKQTVN
jgi:GDP-6-deoxy-D-talose 4-dehydrogenase